MRGVVILAGVVLGLAGFWRAVIYGYISGALSAAGLLLHVVEGGTESVELFVGVPLLACLGLTVPAVRRRRTERRQ